jgi:hypothetical protein
MLLPNIYSLMILMDIKALNPRRCKARGEGFR